ADRLVDAAVQRIREMLRTQELVDAVVDEIVGEDRTQQRLLGVVVDGRRALRDDAAIAAPQPGDVVRAGFHDPLTITASLSRGRARTSVDSVYIADDSRTGSESAHRQILPTQSIVTRPPRRHTLRDDDIAASEKASAAPLARSGRCIRTQRSGRYCCGASSAL